MVLDDYKKYEDLDQTPKNSEKLRAELIAKKKKLGIIPKAGSNVTSLLTNNKVGESQKTTKIDLVDIFIYNNVNESCSLRLPKQLPKDQDKIKEIEEGKKRSRKRHFK